MPLPWHTAPTEKSHFDRFGLVKNNKRVVLVYDVKASILSITAADEQFAEVCSLWNRFSKSGSANTKTSDDIHPKQKLSANPAQNANKSGAVNKDTNGTERGNNGNKTAAVSSDRNKTASDKNAKKGTSGQAFATGKDPAVSQGENVNAAGNDAAKSKSNTKNADKKIKTDKNKNNKSDKNRQDDLSQNAQSAAPIGKTKEDGVSDKTRQSDSATKAPSATNQNTKSADNKQLVKQSETQKGKKQPAKQQETKKDKQPNKAKQISGKNQAESSRIKATSRLKTIFL